MENSKEKYVEIMIKLPDGDYQEVYKTLLNLAIRKMKSQTTIEGCKKVWGQFKKFQENPAFIEAKDEMKNKLS